MCGDTHSAKTLRQVFQEGLFLLKNATDAPAFEADQLFASCLGVKRHQLPYKGEDPAGREQAELFLNACRMRAEGRPLQYILETWEFYGLPFQVGDGVLIPRPDTECLVDTSLRLLEGQVAPVVLDLCAGSGCVSVSIASRRPDAAVTAVELSESALPYLERNVLLNRVSVTAIHGDIRKFTPSAPVFLLVSNPPYIPTEDLPSLQREVQVEPAMALDGGEDGLDFYRLIASRYSAHILPGGYIALEVGFDQAETVSKILAGTGFAGIERHKDLNGVERVVSGQKK